MAIELQYTHDGTGVIFKGRGSVTAEDILWIRQKIYQSDDEIKKIKFFLNDFTDAEIDISMDEDLLISALQDDEAAELNPHIVVAIVSCQELYNKIAMVWQKILSYSPWRTFSTKSYFEASSYIKKYSGVDLLYLHS